jgi:hypothetical protein
MIITSPEALAELFNDKVSGAYRNITLDDVRLLTECGLIGKYRYYGRQDLETIRAVLRYEQLRESRLVQKSKEDKPLRCKNCGEFIHLDSEGKAGRHKEYCSECESIRNRERQKKFL